MNYIYYLYDQKYFIEHLLDNMLGLLFITNHHYYKWYVVILFLETFRNSLLCIHLVLNFKKDKRSILIEMSSLKTKLIFCPLAIDLYYDVFNMRVI